MGKSQHNRTPSPPGHALPTRLRPSLVFPPPVSTTTPCFHDNTPKIKARTQQPCACVPPCFFPRPRLLTSMSTCCSYRVCWTGRVHYFFAAAASSALFASADRWRVSLVHPRGGKGRGLIPAACFSRIFWAAISLSRASSLPLFALPFFCRPRVSAILSLVLLELARAAAPPPRDRISWMNGRASRRGGGAASGRIGCRCGGRCDYEGVEWEGLPWKPFSSG